MADNVYSDGDIEDVILSNINNNEQIEKFSSVPGPVFHNFSIERENIFNWYPFKKSSNVLEIGAGMGALTGCLLDRVNKVVSVEQSEKRAEIIRQRYKDKKNLQVITDDIFTHEFTERFDYVLLIGVLEYVGINNPDNPYIKILSKIKTLLKDDGILLIAIENRFGMKYWLGCAEDHTSIPFDGINDYENQNITGRYGKKGVRTFSKQVLSDFLLTSGFKNYRFYYPLPDYKFPCAVFTDAHLPSYDDIRNIKFYYPEESLLVADEKKIYLDAIQNNVFPFFANSFLIEASVLELENRFVEYASFKRDYASPYKVSTIIWNDKQIFKTARTKEATQHLQNIFDNTTELTNHGIDILPVTFSNDELLIKYCDKQLTINVFNDYILKNDFDSALNLVNKLDKCIRKSSDVKENEIFKFDNETFVDDILENGFLDMTFINSFYYNDSLVFFDQEWKRKNIPVSYIIYRAIKYSASLESMRGKNIINKLYEKLNITQKKIEIFEKMEKEFLLSLMDSKICNILDPKMKREEIFLPLNIKNQIVQLSTELNNKKGHIELLLQSERDLKNQVASLENQNNTLSVELNNTKGHVELLLQSERNLLNEKSELQLQKSQLEKNIDELKNSLSWKLTAPIRKIASLFK